MSNSDRSRAAGIPKKNALTLAIGAALTGQAAHAQTDDSDEIGAIIVTAQKRAESMQDVPISITALTGEDFVRQGLYKFEDYVRFLPSVTYVSSVPGTSSIVFRGLAAAAGAGISDSSVALYLDEQPLTQFSVNVDPRLVDVERVEALAGPQGTLFGDSSQSGTLRIITKKPDATKFDSFADMTVSTGSDSTESYDVAGMVNLPLVEDKFAIRLVGFTAEDGGFIDRVLGTSPTLGAATPARGLKTNASVVEEDFNSVTYTGGRVAARWTPDDTWAITLAGIFQNTEADGLSEFDPGVGDLQTVRFFEEPRDDKWWQTALTIEKSFGNFNFLSATSYFDRKIEYTVDRTEYAAYFNFGFCGGNATNYCWSGLSNGTFTVLPDGSGLGPVTPDDQDTTGFNTYEQWNKRFTQEFRLSQDLDRVRWVAGLFYETKTQEWYYRAYTPEFSSTLAEFCWSSVCYYDYSANTPNPAGESAWWFSHDDVEWEQWAVFGDFTFDITDNWIVSLGARYFNQESERVYEVDKRFINSDNWPDLAPDTGKRKSDDADWVPKVSLSYKTDDGKLFYALYSEGFRAGGVNRNRAPTIFPEEYLPDTLENMEIGTKLLLADGRLQFNATVFQMKWEDFQIEVVDPGFSPCPPPGDPQPPICDGPFQVIVGNVGNAEVSGVEWSIRALIGKGLDVGFDGTYLFKAETEDDLQVTTLVPAGTQLPISAEQKYAAYAQYTWPVQFGQGTEMYARAQYTYTDSSLNQLEPFAEEPPGVSATPQRTMDAYGIADVSIGFSAERWELQAFLDNATDERAEIYWNTDDHQTFWGRNNLATIRPREYGMRFIYRWGD